MIKIERILATTFMGIICMFHSHAQETFQHDWSFGFSLTGWSSVASVAVTPNNDSPVGGVIILGQSEGAIDLDPGAGSAIIDSPESVTFISKYDNDGNYLFSSYFTSSIAIRPLQIATDEEGNIFFAGTYQGTIDFSTFPGGAALSYTAEGDYDIFIAKSSPSGNLLWANSIGGDGMEYIRGIALTTDGNVLITGDFESSTVDFNPDVNVIENLTAAGNSNAYIAKYTESGSLSWVKQISGSCSDVAVDGNGDNYIVGQFRQTIDLDPDPNETYERTSAGGSDIFILKLNENGEFIWAQVVGGAEVDFAVSLAITSTNDVVYSGGFNGTADFDPGPDSKLLTPGTYGDLFISKLDPLGNFIWAVRSLSNFGILPHAISLDQADNAYLTGEYNYGTVDLDPDGGSFLIDNSSYSSKAFVSEWNMSGQFVSAASIDGTYSGTGFSIAHNKNDELIAAGYFDGSADFDPQSTVNELVSAGSGFLFKWNNTCPDKPGLLANGETLSCSSTDVNYTWLDCNDNYSVIAGETNQTFTPTANGNYAVMVDNGFCSDTSDCVVIDFISVDELDQMKISIAPNPTNSNVTIYFNSVVKNAVVEVYDALGQLIGVQQVKHSQQQTIELPKAKGVYFVHVSIDGNPTFVRRVIKR